MARTDSVSVFAEGTFVEQVDELVECIARSKPEAERVAFKQPFVDALKTAEGQRQIDEDEGRKREVITRVVDAAGGLEEGSDREIEGFFNLLFSHLIGLYPSDSTELQDAVGKILGIVSQNGPIYQTSLKYRILSNLFNAIPRISPARLAICKTLLRLASENDELDNLRLTTADVHRWLTEWSASSEEKSEFLKGVADAFASAAQWETAFAFYMLYVRSLPSSESAEATLQLIALALRIPTILDFDPLLRLEGVQALNSHELFRLLVILNTQGLVEFKTWRDQHQSVLDQYQLDGAQLERKLRLLIFSEIGFSKIGRDLHYSEIASALQLEGSEIERWSIDVVRSGLLSGKLSQTTQTLHVIRASPRGFGPEQWNTLEQQLLAWKEGIAGIQSILAATRQSIGASGISEQAA